MLLFIAVMSLVIVAGLWAGTSWIAWTGLGLIGVALLGRLVFAMLGTMPARWTTRRTWWRTNGRRVINSMLITTIIIAVITALVLIAAKKIPPRTPCESKACATAEATTATPAPIPAVVPTPEPNEYTHTFNVGTNQSEVWQFPTNTKGWVLTWNPDDATVPYEVITDHGTFRCVPGEAETEIGPTRTIAFRALSDTATTKVRAVLRKP